MMQLFGNVQYGDCLILLKTALARGSGLSASYERQGLEVGLSLVRVPHSPVTSRHRVKNLIKNL